MTMSVPAPNPYEMLLLLGSTAKSALLQLCSCRRLATSRSAVVQVECSEPFLRTLLSLLSLMHTLPTRCPRGTGVFPTGASLRSTTSLEPRRVVLFSTVCSAAPRLPLTLLNAAGVLPGRDGVAATVQAELASAGWQSLADL